MRRFAPFLAFAIAFFWFSYRAANAWMASGFVDPVGRFGTQDEAIYSRVVLEMWGSGRWLAPTFFDRLAYFKPPLLYWLSAISVGVFGPGHYPFRLPAVMAGAGICALVFAWVKRRAGLRAGIVAFLLLALDPYLVMFASVNMTDALVVFFGLLSLWLIARDPALLQKSTIVLCAGALACAVLAKSIAGLTPALAIVFYWLTWGRDGRPQLSRVTTLAGVFFAIAAPWFVYSLLAHGRWFWTEHVLTELVNSASGAGPLATAQSNPRFYLQRWFGGDTAVAVVYTIGAIVTLRRRATEPLALIWLAVTLITLLAFRQHAAAYLLPAIVATSIAVSSAWSTPMTSFLVLPAALYLALAAPIVWRETNNAEARALIENCDLGRDNPLLLVEPGDEFYSALLPKRQVHYGLIDAGRTAIREPIDWRELGVIVTSEQFAHQDVWWPIFRSRLDSFGLDSTYDPRATTIVFKDRSEVEATIGALPQWDINLPSDWKCSLNSHELRPASPGRVWLLSKEPQLRAPRKIAGRPWTCRL